MRGAREVDGGLRRRLRLFCVDNNGQDVVEYGLIIATIALVVLLGISAFGQLIAPWFEELAGRITTIGT